MQLLAEDLEKIYSKKQWKSQWRLFYLYKNWNNVVGETIGGVTSPAYFRGDVLWIFVENSIWMQQIQYMKLDLLALIREALPNNPLQDIRMKLAHEAITVMEHTQKRPEVAIDRNEKNKFIEMISGIHDNECRSALLGLWMKHKKSGAR